MKKVAKDKLIELLINKNNLTYEELSKITGYHPKSLIRINSEIKKGAFKTHNNLSSTIGTSIQEDYIKSDIKYYKDFYNKYKGKYNISYSMMCRLLGSTNINEEIVFIKRIKEKSNYYFQVIDCQTQFILFNYASEKNNYKTIKKIIYKLLNNYGAPKNISFINLYKEIPNNIIELLSKYAISIRKYKPIYSKLLNNLKEYPNTIRYQKVMIDKRDFYNCITRITIDDNTIQFCNIRYKIKTSNTIKKLTKVSLYYNDKINDLFIFHKNSSYKLIPYKEMISKKGNSKY